MLCHLEEFDMVEFNSRSSICIRTGSLYKNTNFMKTYSAYTTITVKLKTETDLLFDF